MLRPRIVERMVGTLMDKLTDGPRLGPLLKSSVPVAPVSRASSLEKRREPRYPCSDPVKVRVISPVGAPPFPGVVLDVSRSGLRIEVQKPISKGSEIEVTARGKVAIFGEIRYCRCAGEFYHAGVLIRDVVHSRPHVVEHLHDDDLSLYLVGKGLTMPEVLRVREHLTTCETCQLRLGEADAVLHPIRKRKFF